MNLNIINSQNFNQKNNLNIFVNNMNSCNNNVSLKKNYFNHNSQMNFSHRSNNFLLNENLNNFNSEKNINRVNLNTNYALKGNFFK